MDQKTRLDDVENEMTGRQKTIDTIVSDQQRLRENIKSLGQSVEERSLLQRYVAKLEETETSIEKLRAEIAVLAETKNKIQIEINIELRKPRDSIA